jgi:Mg2+ and Co2+ transporter CorA
MTQEHVVVLATDDRIWLDADSVVAYLRLLQQKSDDMKRVALEHNAIPQAHIAYAVGDILRQIADGFVLTSMTAAEAVRERRESRKRH